MRSTPKDPSLAVLYRSLTKAELFWVALTAFYLMKGENTSIAEFIAFVKDEARLQRSQNDYDERSE